MSVALRSRLAKLEQVYDTTDRDEAEAQIRRVCAAHPVFAGHEERIVRALLSPRYPHYEVTIPEGTSFDGTALVGYDEQGRRVWREVPRSQEEYHVSWWMRRRGDPILIRHYDFRDKGRGPGEPVVHAVPPPDPWRPAPRPPEPKPVEPVEDPGPPAWALGLPEPPTPSAYERLMASVLGEQQEQEETNDDE